MKRPLKINSIILLFFLFILTSCGYEKLNVMNSEKYKIVSFKSSGNQRAAYIIKSEVKLHSKKSSNNAVSMVLKVEKDKEIKEKNISNKVSKYSITLRVQLSVIEENAKKNDYFFSKSSDLLVTDSPSETNEEEKKIVEVLAETIANKITQTLNIKYRE